MFLSLYLEALDEELVTLRSSISKRTRASTPKVDELEEEIQSAEGQTEVEKRDCTVRQFLYFCTEFGVADVYVDTNRQVRSSRPSHSYSVERPARLYAC